MQDTKKFLGARIQEIRRQQVLKQTELAEIVGIDSKHMSKIECRRCFPSFELLDKIAFCLKKPVSKFLETEHIENREILLEELIQNLQDMPEEKFRQVYKIIQTFL